MEKGKGKRDFTRLTIHAIWAVLIVCGCLLGCGISAVAQNSYPGDKYGKGGTVTTDTWTDVDGVTYKNVVFKDSNNVHRETQTTGTYKNGKTAYEGSEFRDCQDKPTFIKEVKYDLTGAETFYTDKRFKDGKQVSGFTRYIDEKTGKKVTRKYNPKQEKYEDIAFEGPSEISTPPRDTSACPINNYANQIVGGFDIIRENSTSENFNTYGVYGEYTNFPKRFFRRGFIGLRADFDVNFKQQNGVDLTKTSVLGGIVIVPFPHLTTTDRVTISTQALFGVSHLTSSVGTVSVSNNSFTMKLGGALDVKVTPHFFIRPIGINYAPTRFGGNTQNNVQFTFGAGVRF